MQEGRTGSMERAMWQSWSAIHDPSMVRAARTLTHAFINEDMALENPRCWDVDGSSVSLHPDLVHEHAFCCTCPRSMRAMQGDQDPKMAWESTIPTRCGKEGRPYWDGVARSKTRTVRQTPPNSCLGRHGRIDF